MFALAQVGGVLTFFSMVSVKPSYIILQASSNASGKTFWIVKSSASLKSEGFACLKALLRRVQSRTLNTQIFVE